MMIWPVWGVSGNDFAIFAFVSNNFEGTLKRALDCASYHNARVGLPLTERVTDIVTPCVRLVTPVSFPVPIV